MRDSGCSIRSSFGSILVFFFALPFFLSQKKKKKKKGNYTNGQTKPKTRTRSKERNKEEKISCFFFFGRVKSRPSDLDISQISGTPNNGTSVTSEQQLADFELGTSSTRIMELTDSTIDELVRDPKPSVLGIDLNEIPSGAETLPTDSVDVVRSYHDNPSPPPGGPAGVPSAELGSSCAACGKPEARGHVVVCDACERGFHLGCARMRPPVVSIMEEWVCEECECSGVKSKRWPLGKSKRILDMNASPPSDGDGDAEGTEELLGMRYGSFRKIYVLIMKNLNALHRVWPLDFALLRG